MPFELQPNEEVKMTAEFHWSTYVPAGMWAILGSALAITQIYMPNHPMRKVSVLLVLAAGYVPLIVRWVKTSAKACHVTTKRIHFQAGVFRKTEIEIPYEAVQDLKFSQGPLQRLVGTGNVAVFALDVSPIVLIGIEEPEVFRDRIIEAMTRCELEREYEKKNSGKKLSFASR